MNTLDEDLIDKAAFTPTTKWGKIRIGICLLTATMLTSLNLFYYYFWNLSTKYLGWVPTFDNPDPGKMWDSSISRGDVSLESTVVYYLPIIFDSTIAWFYLYFFMYILLIFFVISFIDPQPLWKKIAFLYFSFVFIFSSYMLFFGDFLGWIMD